MPWITFPGNPVAWQENLVGREAELAKGSRQVPFPTTWPSHVPSAPWGFQMHIDIPGETANHASEKSLKLALQLI